MAGDISGDVKAFIQRTINSIEQLEVLLFLMSNQEQAWTADQVSQKTRIPIETVSQRMEELSAGKLLVSEETDPASFRYAPSSKTLAREVAESLQNAYLERRDTVVQLIYSRPLDNIRIFADAFRIKKEEE